MRKLFQSTKLWLIPFIFIFVIQLSEAEAQITLQLSASNHNGYNISCFGGSNGSIDLTISGGILPYTILWSTNETIEDLTNLPAGYYRVTVDDADSLTEPVETEITLTEPRKLSLSADVFKYPNNFNISLYGACNGITNLSAIDGIAPYTWLWSDGNTSQYRFAMCADRYEIEVTDINGCKDKITDLLLIQPDRSDWQMIGNSNTNPSSDFIGTNDSIDLVIKTNTTEKLRISASGDIKVANFSGSNATVYADENGILKTGVPTNPVAPCSPGQIGAPVWFSFTNPLTLFTCPNTNVGIGNWSPLQKLHVEGNAIFTSTTGGLITSSPLIKGGNTFAQSSATNPDYTWQTNTNTGIFHPETNTMAFSNSGEETMRLIYDGIQHHGKVMIGSDIPMNSFTNYSYSLYVSRGIMTEKVRVAISTTNDWNDKVFEATYNLMSLPKLKEFILNNNHLPGIPCAEQVVKEGIDLGEMNSKLLQKIEELTLYVIKLDEEVKVLKAEKNENKKD